MKKKVLLLVLLVIVIVLSLVYWKTTTEKSTSQLTNTISNETDRVDTETNLVTILSDILDALSYYNLSTTALNASDDTSVLMNSLMDAKKHMIRGDVYISGYTKNPNEYISVTAQGMLMGSKMVQDSTDALIQYLRKTDENDPSTFVDLKYQVAKYLSDNKDGFMLIAQSAPQVTSLLWKPAETDNPTGPIPYTVSKKDRQQMLDKIDQLFAKDLEEYYSSTDNYNSMIFAVDAIKNNIKPDTYEEAKAK